MEWDGRGWDRRGGETQEMRLRRGGVVLLILKMHLRDGTLRRECGGVAKKNVRKTLGEWERR